MESVWRRGHDSNIPKTFAGSWTVFSTAELTGWVITDPHPDWWNDCGEAHDSCGYATRQVQILAKLYLVWVTLWTLRERKFSTLWKDLIKHSVTF